MTTERAFPTSKYNTIEGMTLRDYFAAKAMQTMLQAYGPQDFSKEVADDIACRSYLMAHTMMGARDD